MLTIRIPITRNYESRKSFEDFVTVTSLKISLQNRLFNVVDEVNNVAIASVRRQF